MQTLITSMMSASTLPSGRCRSNWTAAITATGTTKPRSRASVAALVYGPTASAMFPVTAVMIIPGSQASVSAAATAMR